MVDLPKDIQREYGSDDYPEKVIRAINNTFDNAIIATDVGQNQLCEKKHCLIGKMLCKPN